MTEHKPVMLNEAMKFLNLKNSGLYLDCTFGAGGYTSKILEQENTKVVAIDRDPSTEKYANDLKKRFGQRIDYISDNFRNLKKFVEQGIKFDGVLYDLGASSMQFDIKERGFSFQEDARLDMRMGNNQISAYDVVNSYSEKQLSDILFFFGGENKSRKIASEIIKKREQEPIKSTMQLASLVSSIVRFKRKIHPATKTFQAIRIEVNEEIDSLKESLKWLPKILKDSGRVVIVTFHSVEDRIVKNFFQENSNKRIAASKYKKTSSQDFSDENEQNYKTDEQNYNIAKEGKPFKLVSKKVIKPPEDEVRENSRARSAKLRVVEKMEEVWMRQ